ncbi:hypothetical protein [Alcaligenes sp. YSL9]|uniref:hypothetical protein n=1 Tax=Alcaligenes sp. YSL9 TaxID=2939596 RepID=UPI00266C74CD|nr:hypothetical protein [Alcaligenes sp. YSL9]
MKNRISIASLIFLLLQNLLFITPTYAASSYWMGTQTFQLNRLSSYQETYDPSRFGHNIPPGSRITRVEVGMSGTQVNTISANNKLCWNSTTNCVNFLGKDLTTRVFNDLDASKPFYVIFDVRSWGSGRPPIYVPTTVTVYYSYP